MSETLFETLERINQRPDVYSRYTADALWTWPDISKMMLRYHLDGEVDLASRRTPFIDASCEWVRERFDLGPGKRSWTSGAARTLRNRLARTSAHVTRVDFSARSIEYARERAAEAGLDVDYRLGDYLTLELRVATTWPP